MTKSETQEFAVIQTGGKQYKVRVGEIVSIERLPGEPAVGDTIVFPEVVLVDDGKNTTLGTPFVNGAKVTGILEEEGRGKKLSIIRFRAKSNYHRKLGHRQSFMKVKITSLS